MRHYLRAILIVSTTLGAGTAVWGQSSSSPFSGLFGRSSQAESPVDLTFQVAGDDGTLERQLRNGSLVAGALREGRVSGQDILAAARADYARILGILYDEGYYSGLIDITLDGVDAAGIAPLDAPSQVSNVVVSVTPGAGFRFSRAAIAPLAPDTELPSGYKTGEIAGTGTIKAAALAGVDGWRDHGHAKAEVAGQQITADHITNRVDSQIALDPGPPVTFGQLNITGYRRMNPRRLAKMAGFPTGKRYDPEEIEEVRKRLRRTGVFSAITLDEAETLSMGNTMDVNLTVVEQKPRRIGAGFELSTTNGTMVTAYWMHRNLLGGGERLRVEGKLSDIGSSVSGQDEELSLRIDRPATITADTTAFVETSVDRTREEDYDADTGTVTLGFNRIFNDRVNANAAIEYQFSRVYDDDRETDFQVIAFPADVVWDRRDVMNNPKRGYYLSGGVTPFVGLQDTGSGTQVKAEGRGFYSFGESQRLTLAGRAQLGSVIGPDIEDTPRNYLFFSGGGGTVRGHPYQSLGVRVIPGTDGLIKTGGMSTAIASGEVRFQLREKIGLVLFADYGQVWVDGGWGGESGSHAGAGLGLRYDTPIGPLRFDVAGPVSGDTGEGAQLYLGLGQAF